MDEATVSNTSFGRRAFLKGAAATLGLAAVAGAGCSPKEELAEEQPAEQAPIEAQAGDQAPEEQHFQGLCRGNCGGGCRLDVHVRDGKVVKTNMIPADDEIDNRICIRGWSHPQRIYAPERVKYPMRRVEGSARGEGQWEQLTWDEAIDYIAEKWSGYIEEFGPGSVGFSYCAGTYAYNMYTYWRLINSFGGSTWEQPQDMAALNLGKDVFGRSNYLVGNDYHDARNSKYVFVWASNATVNTLPRVNDLLYVQDNGGKIIVIDPNYNGIAAKCDMWVPIRPGSDAALALSMLKVIVDEGLGADREFLAKLTVAPFLVKESDGLFLRYGDIGKDPIEGPIGRDGNPTMVDPIVVIDDDGNVDVPEAVGLPVVEGEFEIEGNAVKTAYTLLLERIADWTPERAEEYTDVPADTIRELARMYAEGPTSLWPGFGIDHWGNGAVVTHCQFALAICSGQFAKKGAGISGSQGGGCTGFTAINWTNGIMYTPNSVFGGVSSMIQYLPEVVDTGMYNGQPLTIKSLLFVCGNPLATSPDKNELLRTLDQVELIVSAETVMSDTARYADIVLPVPHWFEYETCMSTPNKFMDMNEAAIPPQFESKPDVEICALIGQKMGLPDWEGVTNESYHRGCFADNPACEALGISWENIKEKKRIQWAPDEYIYGTEENPCTNPYGRAAFYLENPHPMHTGEIDAKRLCLPSFEAPIEAWTTTVEDNEANPLAEKYPLTIITFRDKMKVHSGFALCPMMLEIQPEPTLLMNPVDAEARGIAENDLVRAFNDRGECVLRCHIDPGFRPGMVKTEHGWLGEQYIKGSQNELTSDAVRNMYPSAEHFDTLCEVEKYTA